MSHENPMPIPSNFIGKSDHARDMHALQIPCQSHQKSISVLCYIYPVYFWLPRLSRWGIPPPRPPPWYGRARPCARAERERGGSGAAAERRPTGTCVAIAQPQHPAPHPRVMYSHVVRTRAAPCRSSARHPAHAAAKTATSSHSPPDAHPSPPAVPFHVEHGGVLPPLHSMRPCTPCRAMLHYAREPAALHSRHPCTTRCAPLHYAPPQLPFTQPG